ncbi:hypothetical protein [Rhizobium leguminosarum]|uniref:hypothetical protein n=1 Tax=Rhizobium leguminosarum TaxID=384 RepID=UPI003D6F0045
MNTDITVYCEGKSEGSADPEQTTLDVYYWRKVVGGLGLSKRYHFKSVGSKSTLREIAQVAENESISTVTVCYDRDYDHQLGKAFPSHRTASTRGYSWENDVLSGNVFLDVVADIIGPGASQAESLLQVGIELQRTRRTLAKWTEIDISLQKVQKPSIFDRKNPSGALDHQNLPHLRENALRARLISCGYVRRPRRVCEVSEDAVTDVCFGKLIARSLYHYAMKICNNFAIAKVTYDYFMRQIIAAAFRDPQSALVNYHKGQSAAFS